jgi:Transposase DDE domain
VAGAAAEHARRHHTTLSRRSRGFAGRPPKVVPHGPLHLVIDSTGLKLFGQGEWGEETHGRTRRSWRKLPLAVNAGTGEIVPYLLTDNAADDAGQVLVLLEATEGEIASVTAEGAYDGEPVYQAIASHQPDPSPDVVIPPRAPAGPGTENAEARSRRDRHIRLIAAKGRMAWQEATGYGRRRLAETAVGRHKAMIGPKLRARSLPAQQGEVAVAAEGLNRMIRGAKPVSTRVT